MKTYTVSIDYKTSKEWQKYFSTKFNLNSKSAWEQDTSFYEQLVSEEEFLKRAFASGVTWHVEKL